MENIQFRKITLEDRSLIQSFFDKYPSHSCERTFANAYLWARHYNVSFALIHNALVFCSNIEGESFSYPLGEEEDIKEAIEWILAYTKQNNIPLCLYNVTHCQWEQLLLKI